MTGEDRMKILKQSARDARKEDKEAWGYIHLSGGRTLYCQVDGKSKYYFMTSWRGVCGKASAQEYCNNG